MRFADFAAREQVAIHARHSLLTRVAAKRMNARIERNIAPLQCIERHCPADDRGGKHLLELEKSGQRECR